MTNIFSAIEQHDVYAAALLAKAARAANYSALEMFAVLRYIEATTQKSLYSWFDSSAAEEHGFSRDDLEECEVFQALREQADEYLASLKAV